MVATEVSTRSQGIVGAAVLVSLLLTLFGASAALPSAGPERADRVVAQLVALAGLEASDDPRSKLPVRVNQEGGPLWLTDAVEAAVERDPALRLTDDGVGLVRVEVVSDETHLALRGGLFRQGWNLRSEHPLRVRVVPFIPMLALALGLGAVVFTRRRGIGFAVAGIVAQALDRLVGWPDAFVDVPWTAQLRDGPLGGAVIDLARAMPDSGVALGAGVVTLCMVLVAFDHRRSSGKGGAMLAAGLAGALGLTVWLEAAARCGMAGWIGTAAGAGSILAMALAWGQQGRTLRRA